MKQWGTFKRPNMPDITINRDHVMVVHWLSGHADVVVRGGLQYNVILGHVEGYDNFEEWLGAK